MHWAQPGCPRGTASPGNSGPGGTHCRGGRALAPRPLAPRTARCPPNARQQGTPAHLQASVARSAGGSSLASGPHKGRVCSVQLLSSLINELPLRALRRDPTEKPPGLNSSCFHIWMSWWRVFLPRRRVNRLVRSLFLKRQKPGHPRTWPERPELDNLSGQSGSLGVGVMGPRAQSHWGQLFRAPGVLGVCTDVRRPGGWARGGRRRLSPARGGTGGHPRLGHQHPPQLALLCLLKVGLGACWAPSLYT